MVFDPALVKQLFQGSNAQLHAGEANALLGPVARRALGAAARRGRAPAPPPAAAAAVPRRSGCRRYADVMRESADRAIDGWPVGEPFAVLPSMQSLTLRGDRRAVFGFEPGPGGRRLRDRPARDDRADRPAAGDADARAAASAASAATAPARRREFERRKREVDELLYGEIARRRADPDLAERDDVFSALLLARDEDGEPPLRTARSATSW